MPILSLEKSVGLLQGQMPFLNGIFQSVLRQQHHTVFIAGYQFQNSLHVEKELEQAGIRVYHSDRFIVRNPTDKQFLRVSLSDGNMSKFEKGLAILKEYLET